MTGSVRTVHMTGKRMNTVLWWVAQTVSAVTAGAGLYLLLFDSLWLGATGLTIALVLSGLASLTYGRSLWTTRTRV